MKATDMRKTFKAFRGLTLMEALLFLGLAAVVIVGAFTLYNNASGTSKMNEARTQLQTYVGGLKSLYSTQNDFSSMNTRLVISAGIAPAQAVDGNRLINPWGGQTVIAGQTRSFSVTFRDVPDEACTSLLSSGLINQGTVIEIGANGTTYTTEIDPATAIATCNRGAAGNDVEFIAR